MKNFIKKELIYGAKNYSPINVCIATGKGIFVTDTRSNTYMDFISAYSSLNQGHCHPRLLKVLNNQAKQLTLTSRAVYNNVLGDYMEKICTTFNYDNMLPMNSGVEAGESAIKIARSWGYNKKNVKPEQAVNLFCTNNFWGRTLAAVSTSNDPLGYENFGPFMNGFDIVEYDNVKALEEKFKTNPNIVSFMLEPIQGEAGIIIPSDAYLSKVRELCDTYNVLMIADEVQTGLGRTGKMLACDYNNIQPDLLVLGKALSGGIMPISAVLANKDIMDVMTPGVHGSTFGGNPLSAAIGIEAINIIEDEKLVENSFIQGEYFREQINNFDFDCIKGCRGKGLLNAIELDSKNTADKLSETLLKNGMIAKTTHDNILRLSPPLIITKQQIDDALYILQKSLKSL